jgi:hypothetical protein
MKPIAKFILVNMSDGFLVQNCLKHRGALSPLIFKFALEYAIMKVQENKRQIGIEQDS